MLKKYLAHKNQRPFNNQGQHLMEYTIVIGVIIGALLAMNPLLKWGLQGMIKVAADQIVNQTTADQAFDERGHLRYSYTTMRGRQAEQVLDRAGQTRYVYPLADSQGSYVQALTEAETNLGLTRQQ